MEVDGGVVDDDGGVADGGVDDGGVAETDDGGPEEGTDAMVDDDVGDSSSSPSSPVNNASCQCRAARSSSAYSPSRALIKLTLFI